MNFYEIYYRNKSGWLAYCGDVDTEQEAIEECKLLGCEFPENEYFYECVQYDG